MNENVGTRYLFDKNETGLTLEDNLISTLDWDISKKGHLQAFEYLGGNYIKLTKIPKGIKVYWNTKNDRAGAMLLDDVNRGVKVSKQNKWGQLMAYRNYYLWSEGTLSQDETNPHIILEFTGKGVEVEYLVGSATEIQLLADQFNALNENLNKMAESLSQIEVSSTATAIANPIEVELPKDFQCTCTITQSQINKIASNLRPNVSITNHINHYHVHLAWTAAQTVSANVSTLLSNLSNFITNQNIGILTISSNYNIEYSLSMSMALVTDWNYTTTSFYDECFTPASVKGIQTLTLNDTNFNFYNTTTGTQPFTGMVSNTNNKATLVMGGSQSGMRALKNQTNYVGLAIGYMNNISSAMPADMPQWLLNAGYSAHVVGTVWQIDYVFAIERIWKN